MRIPLVDRVLGAGIVLVHLALRSRVVRVERQLAARPIAE